MRVPESFTRVLSEPLTVGGTFVVLGFGLIVVGAARISSTLGCLVAGVMLLVAGRLVLQNRAHGQQRDE